MSVMLPNELVTLLNANDWQSKAAALRMISSKKLHLPEEVLRLGTSLLLSNSWQLGSRYWEICELVFYASLECQATDWIKFTLKSLENKFGSTPKTQRLKGILLEYNGKFTDAEKVYEELLVLNPLDKTTWKRKASMYRSVGNTDQAIDELNKYLEIFQDDIEVWEELSDIYLSIQQFAKAAYCYEEVLVKSSENFWVVLKYGEIVYSAGGVEKMGLARKYFIQALVLNPQSLRAMWALYQCTFGINALKADPVNSRIKEKVMGQIVEAYKGSKVDIKRYLA